MASPSKLYESKKKFSVTNSDVAMNKCVIETVSTEKKVTTTLRPFGISDKIRKMPNIARITMNTNRNSVNTSMFIINPFDCAIFFILQE